MQDVPYFARRMGLELECYLDRTRPARLDEAHSVRINYEAFFFSCEENRASFLADPLAFCGLLTDPVSKRRFHPRPGSPRTEHGGVTYFFESNGTRARFARRPDAYRLPGWSM